MGTLSRLWALVLAVALLPVLGVSDALPSAGLQTAASADDVAARPDHQSNVANREDRARRTFRHRQTEYSPAWPHDYLGDDVGDDVDDDQLLRIELDEELFASLDLTVKNANNRAHVTPRPPALQSWSPRGPPV